LIAIIKHLERFTPFEKYFISKQIDLIYFLSPSGWVSDLEKINYITTVWDLCHRDDPEFPEVRLNREFEGREQNYQSILPKAVAVFVDSLMGKENVIRRYGVDRVRTYVMPFQAAIATQNLNELNQKKINISKKYDLDVPYVFYPAQFWAHKNHIYLLEGLHALEKEHNLKVGAIFSGGDQGNITHVKNYVHQLRLEERVRFVGFVKNEEIPDLYCQSIALVMPTYFGPTNLPPLEAFALRVPVLYSDKAGLRDQVGDAALLMDLSDPSSMANHLKALIEDESVRNALINSGTLQLENLNSLDRVGILKIVIEKFRWRRVCWD
jgi:glycosyltransferase involved in cell wall biosynthesis